MLFSTMEIEHQLTCSLWLLVMLLYFTTKGEEPCCVHDPSVLLRLREWHIAVPLMRLDVYVICRFCVLCGECRERHVERIHH